MHVIAEVLRLTSRLTYESTFYRAFAFEVGVNVPFCFSLAVLLYCVIVAARSGVRAYTERRESFCWWGIAGAAVAVASVTIIGARKTVELVLPAVIQRPAVSMVVGLAAIVAAVFFLRSLLKLSASTRRRLAVAAGVYLTGAVAFELLSEHYCGRREFPATVIYAVVSTIEEVLEMSGILLVILAMRRHRQASS